MTELEEELLSALEFVLLEYKQDCFELYPHITFDGLDEVIKAHAAIAKAYGETP